MGKQQLSQAIWHFGQENGREEMAGICARTLVGLAHATGGNELEFTCDQGKVNVVPDSISGHLKN